jgi:hypothetical protein
LFGLRETIAGTTGVLPIARPEFLRPLKPAFIGAIQGRFVDVRSAADEEIPSIETLYDEAAAPGLGNQPHVLELSEGIRLKPSLFGERLRLNYLFRLQQFVAGEAASSFRRWTLDFSHEIPLYRNRPSYTPRDTNGPDECFVAAGTATCPAVSRNRGGAIGFRVRASSASATAAGGHVPFYFQPTLGGGDINGDHALDAYDDYRFRGPHLLLFEESLEHSLWGPLGAWIRADQGKVAASRDRLGFDGLAHSVAVGLSLRAGGFPQVVLSFAWGGEGHHVAAAMNTTLLGGSARPPLD